MEVKELFPLHCAFWRVSYSGLTPSSTGVVQDCSSVTAFAPKEEVFLKQAGTCVERGQLPSYSFHRPSSLSGVSKLPDLYAVIPGMQLGLQLSVWLTSQLKVSFPMGIRLDRLSFAVPNSA